MAGVMPGVYHLAPAGVCAVAMISNLVRKRPDLAAFRAEPAITGWR